jgi:hypothetical protein
MTSAESERHEHLIPGAAVADLRPLSNSAKANVACRFRWPAPRERREPGRSSILTLVWRQTAAPASSCAARPLG